MSPIDIALSLCLVLLCLLALGLTLYFTSRIGDLSRRIATNRAWIEDHDDTYLRRERGLQVRREAVKRDLDEAKRIASAVTLAASDVLAKLSEFMEENKFDPSSPYFDEEAYESAIIDAYKNPIDPATLRECCEGRKPGCPDWLFIGDFCEKLWGLAPDEARPQGGTEPPEERDRNHATTS